MKRRFARFDRHPVAPKDREGRERRAGVVPAGLAVADADADGFAARDVMEGHLTDRQKLGRFTASHGLLLLEPNIATSRFLHESIGTGMMRMVFFFYAIPVLSLAFVAWAMVIRSAGS